MSDSTGTEVSTVDGTLDAPQDVPNVDIFDAISPRDHPDAADAVEAPTDVYEANDTLLFDVATDELGGDTGSCRADSSALFCGNNCTECLAPTQAVPHCNGNTCALDLQCEPSFGDCDLQRVNGCEVSLANDPLNCRACGTACATPAHASATCAAGVCDFVCIGGYVRRGALCVVPPVGLRRPLSAAAIVGNRPTFRWAALEAADAYRIEICTSRDCLGANIVETAIVRGANTYLLQNYRVNSRAHFWRVHALVAGVVESTSATWTFRSVNPRAAETRQRYTTMLDMNGDGAEELIASNGRVENGLPIPACSIFAWNRDRGAGQEVARLDATMVPLESCVATRLGDTNGDGLSDWLAESYELMNGIRRLYFLAGQANFDAIVRSARPIAHPTGYTWVGDVNDDGFQDGVGTVEVGPRFQLAVFYGTPEGRSAVGVPISDATDAAISTYVVLDDLDNDGRPELITGSPLGVYGWSGSVLARAPLMPGLPRGEFPARVLVDLNGDGISDGWRGAQIQLNGPAANPTDLLDVQTQTRIYNSILPLGDINEDGLEDAAGYGWDAQTWWLEVLLGSRVNDELRVPDFRQSVTPVSLIAAVGFWIGAGSSFLDFRGDGASYLAIGGFGHWLAVHKVGSEPGRPNLLSITTIYSLASGGFGSTRSLTLAPSTLLPLRTQSPVFYPSSRFLWPSLQPHARYRFLTAPSAHATTLLAGDYS